MSDRVALVTGASRGIGKAIAVSLAEAGFDVAILARTLQEGEQREHSSTLKASDTSALPGSLTSTAELVRAAGREALVLQGDLLDFASLGAAAARLLERWGRVDVVVHNARYIGPGHMDRFLDTPIAILDAHLQANVLATLVLNQLLLPSMIEHGGGTVVNITSASGYADPTEPAGEGGWGMGYGISKGAMQRIAGFLAVELREQGVRAFNVQPGFIATERIAQDMAKFGFDASAGAPASVIGAVVAWLATDPGAAELNGTTIEAQYFAHEKKLVADWGGPVPGQSIRYDMAAANIAALEEQLRAGSSS
jgi:NAD(P)-dependent dehydrogenase (short-subunit alcohol dehydrogenase family)